VSALRPGGYTVGMNAYQRIEKVIRYVDARREEQPRLEELARVAGLSPFHFHRLFRRWAGVTPKSFLRFVTAQDAKALLRGGDVLGAALETGLSGPGRLHDLMVTVEAVTPGQWKKGGAGLVIRHGFHDTPLGEALFGVTERGLCHLAFVEDRRAALARLRKLWPKAELRESCGGTAGVAKAAFSRRGKVKLLLGGTPFQLKVWEALLRIPAGRAVRYGDVARAIGHPSATRAVGTAVGANPIACLIPCHRVLQSTGAFGGYRWGPARKRLLLASEARA
jgi:AraC family transcriptional regulator, regulatory protein of adaptative response / methylated-DNA-[protein]-cysteine methyltransferase